MSDYSVGRLKYTIVTGIYVLLTIILPVVASAETAPSLRVTTNVQAYSATAATATLTFAGNVTGDIIYELRYGEGSNLDQKITGNFKMAQTSYPTTIDEELRGLQAGKSYSFQLVARYDNTDDVSSAQGTFETPVKTLKISAVEAINVTTKTASIQMTLLGNATEYVYYEINYSKNSDMSGGYKKVGNFVLNSLSGQTFAVGIDQLEEESTYYFTVSAKYADTDADSKSGQFTTPEKISYVAPDKVDLGCSVLWGTFNLGAKNETGRGGFFGWGDPTGENISQYQAYGDRYVTPPADLTKEHQELDIVHVTLEDNWHTPTAAQMLELLTKCTWEHVSNYQGVAGLDGYIVRGKGQYANNHIFIPHSGYRKGIDSNGNAVYSPNTNECYYWSSQLTDSPWGYGIYVKLQPGTTGPAKEQTFIGMHIRPVYGESSRTCSLSITASGNGSATYNGTSVRNNIFTFSVNEGASATITFSPDNGYKIKSVKENNTNVTWYVSNNSYTISNISRNTNIEVEFEADSRIEAGAAQADFTTATIPVTVISDGEIEIGSYGIRYATKADMSDAKTVKGTTASVVNTVSNITLTDLEVGTTYYYQAFANLTTPAMNLETAVASFTTRAMELALDVSVSDKTTTTATLDLAFTGNIASTVYYDVVYSTDKNLPEDAESTKKTSGSFWLTKANEEQHAEVILDGLEPGTTYYYRVTAYYAESSKKTVNGNFETASQALSVSELTSSDVTFDEATITFTLTSNVLSEVSYTIEYGTDAALTNPSKKDGKITLTSTTGQKVTDKLGGLKEGTKYYYRVVANSGDKEVASGVKSFETKTTTTRSLKVTASVEAYSATAATATLTFVGNVTGDVSYELHYGEGSNLDQQITGNFNMTQTSYPTTIERELTSLQAGKSYSFQLVARYNGADDVSSQGTFETPAKTLKISAVDAVYVRATTARIQMKLLGNATEYVYYEIYYSKNSDMSDNKKVDGNVVLTSFTGQTFAVGIDQLEEQSKYYFTVSVKYADTDADSKSGTFTTEKMFFVTPDMVDLGCSVLWGTFNLGAKDETGRGGFYGWGDPTGEHISQYQGYGDRYVTPPADLTKEHQELDIVHVMLEDKWHTPTADQMMELLTKCTWEQTSNYQGVQGLDGYVVRGKGQYANNHIFIPCSGYREGIDADGNVVYSTNYTECYYWSSQLTDSPWGYGIYVKLQPGTTGYAKEQTFYGMHLRPVYDKTSEDPVVEDDHSMDVAKTVKDAFGNDMIVPADGVDLGLSVKWATWNVGAKETGVDGKGKEGQYGNYYSWGSTEPQSSYLSSDYQYYSQPITERTLSAEHDAAQTKWGDGWRMPTEDECEELILNCNVSWTSVDGVSGYRYTSRINGKSIFMPAAGVWTSRVQDSGEYGYYWTSTKHVSNHEQAICMVFNSDGRYNDASMQYERFGGLQIRPVRSKSVSGTCSLNITASGNGSATYDGTSVRNRTTSFTVNEGTNATITFSPDNGNSIASVKVNNSDVTSQVSGNRYTINNITANTTLEVTFQEDVNAMTVDGVNYAVVSQTDRTVKVAGGDFGQVLTVPATVTQNGKTWTVTGIDANALKNNTELAAVIWNPTYNFTATVSNPNLLLYVKSSGYAPSSIQNVVVNGTASNIVLKEASSGNNFYCPQTFVAQKISYTHNYQMQTGVGESKGWETIALPFDVQTITHETKGTIVPFAQWNNSSNKKPFWLMELTGTGFVETGSIKAYTPYIISMPNNPQYDSQWQLKGKVTFAASSVTIAKTENLNQSIFNGRTFIPCFAGEKADEGFYALNVSNDWETNNSGMTEGSKFVLNMRRIHPFEAYMTSSSNAAPYFDVFDDMTTGIHVMDEGRWMKEEAVYDLQGRKVENPSKKGVYIVNGKKKIVK